MISSCRCDPQLDSEMMAARAHACLLTARDDAVLCSTPCFSCSAVLLFVPIFASRLSARECESKSVARSPARSRNAKPAVLRKSLLVVFAVKTFFSSPSSGAPGVQSPPAALQQTSRQVKQHNKYSTHRGTSCRRRMAGRSAEGQEHNTTDQRQTAVRSISNKLARSGS